MWMVVHVWALYSGVEWEMYGVWYRTPFKMDLEAIWADIGRRIACGPPSQELSQCQSYQILVQEEDQPPRNNAGQIIPQTDVSIGIYANPVWYLIPNFTFEEEGPKSNGNR